MSFKNKVIKAKCVKIVFPGRSFCECEDNKVLFCEGLLPSEEAEVLVVRDTASFREGYVKNIVVNSIDRRKPLCLSFGSCGGCSFQHLDYEKQVEYKKFYLNEILKPVNCEVKEIFKPSEILNYRNKMEFSFFHNVQEGRSDIGLHCRGRFNKYVSVPPCFIADKSFLKILEIVRDFANKNNFTVYDNKTHQGFLRHLVLRKAQNNNQLLVNIVTNSNFTCLSEKMKLLAKELAIYADSVYWTSNSKLSDAVLADNLLLLEGKENIVEKLNVNKRDYFFNISPFSFFQTNSKGTEILYNAADELLDLNENDNLLDLYCGTGTIGISLSQKAKHITGVDENEQSIENARQNAILNQVKNASFVVRKAQAFSEECREEFSAIVVDPPRAGLVKEVIDFLTNSKAKKLLYISCNPSTLARDINLILKNSKISVKSVLAVDMFPQTYHIETIVLFSKH